MSVQMIGEKKCFAPLSSFILAVKLGQFLAPGGDKNSTAHLESYLHG